ncbi:MAG: DUF192 domain-containing protein [Myxococcales bacterium]|nr:DUF192 domain-containing protein [Myxococcales bacterium]
MRWTVAILLALGSCRQSTPAEPSQSAPASTNPSPTAPTAREPAVLLRPSGHPESRVTVEVARTDAVRQRGLMFRREMAEDRGMIFVFPRAQNQVFWMHNTYIPLDMIFIREDQTILGIVENATPETDTGRSVPGDSLYVLEVNGGWSRRHHVAAGDRVELVNVPPALE